MLWGHQRSILLPGPQPFLPRARTLILLLMTILGRSELLSGFLSERCPASSSATSPRLCDIAMRACGGEDTSEDLLAWLASVFPSGNRVPRPVVHNGDLPPEGERPKSRKEARRREYATVQRIYGHDQRAAVGRILDDELDVNGSYPCPSVDFADCC